MRRFCERNEYTQRGCLHLDRKVLRGICALSGAIALCPESDDLRRLTDGQGLIHACAEEMAKTCIRDLPAHHGRARILALAREMVAGGERRMDEAGLLGMIEIFDEKHGLEMAEVMHMCDAIRIALCEAWLEIGREILVQGRIRMRAKKWISGRRRRTADTAVFWAHALQYAAENEDSNLRGRIESQLKQRGQSADLQIEAAQRLCGRNCLRLDNLMALRSLIDSLDWQACFIRLSAAEAELREDAVYAGMDDESQNDVRMAAAELARSFGMREIRLIRSALDLAQRDEKTVCHYLYCNEGRRELRDALGITCRIRRCVPDAGGRKTVIGVSTLVFALMLAFFYAIEDALLVIYELPLAWAAAMTLIGRFYPHFVRPQRLLRMEADRVKDTARTIVVLPVLLSSESRAAEMLRHMEALGCLEKDENIDYLLLGDFRDSQNPEEEDDKSILLTLRAGIAGMNHRAERKKYYYLHRGRSYREIDGRWMGENRKRGALTALNRLLLGISAEGFDAENADAAELTGRYRYAVTLDADTEYLPGTLQKLIGAMEHPLNRDYAVLQPCMQMTVSACRNEYVRILYADGGLDSYPVSVSDFYQDICSKGCFAGKGIYRIEKFYCATENRLPDANILSHDLIEGVLSGAGFLGDVHFYDGCPDNLASDLKRSHRWTRGDWQLLPVLLLPGIAAVDRMKMIGNLLRSLYAPALLGLLIHALWLDAPYAFALGLLLAFLEPVLRIGDRRVWKRALVELSLLPVHAKNMLDAILRTLWRLAVSKKHLMEWVPAADAGSSGEKLNRYGRMAALLLLPGLLSPFWVPAVLALGALFFIGADWAEDLSEQEIGKAVALSGEQADFLMELAGRTWRFFEQYVPMKGNGLPPDNVQMDPPAGIAPRTSPTNIGLYLLSCLSACKLGLIGQQECLERMERTVCTLETMDKWRGQLYNWYDIYSLEPLNPRYVSAVDSGNLAASLLLCAAESGDDALSDRLRTLAEGMDLAALYDEKRHLFRIGMDAEREQLSQSHYDLYASESRILSFAAMMLGQVPVKHWTRLSRPAVHTAGGMALCSWSGTMFEYLMPEIFFASPVNTLAGQSAKTVSACQRHFGKKKNRPWGISESGYYAFDMHLNYQYRAFGLRKLSLSGENGEDVAAPYASVLALRYDADAAENLRRMTELGWHDEYGFYEAADYLHTNGQGEPRLVKSHMAHHQGMILCALCNALRSDYLSRSFTDIPQAQALRLLLEEKPLRLAKDARKSVRGERIFREEQSLTRNAMQGRIEDVHLLHGGGVTALMRSDGALFAWSGDVQLNRFSGDLRNIHEGLFVHLRLPERGKELRMGESGRLIFDGGCAKYSTEWEGLQLKMESCISPEDGTIYQRVSAENIAQKDIDLEISGCLAVALADQAAMRAHPVFQNLFVEAHKQSENRLYFNRKPRSEHDRQLQMVYMAFGGEEYSCECDLEKLTGRTGSLRDQIAAEFSGTDGNTLNPCAAIRMKIRIPAGHKRTAHFALLYGDAGNERAKRCGKPESVDRALQLARTRERAVLHFSGIDARSYRILQRTSALLLDAGLKNHHGCAEPMRREELWSLGISGDLPVMLMEIADPAHLARARQMIHAHAFYCMMGLQTDLVFVNAYGSGYLQPVYSGLEDMISAGHLSGRRNMRGGVFVIDRQNLKEEQMVAIRRAACLRPDSSADVFRQMNVLWENCYEPAEKLAPMEAEAIRMPELDCFNGYGGFDGNDYVMLVGSGHLPPAPWSNILACGDFGALMTDRGGGFAWHGNSRSGRLTPFANDILHEGWGWMPELIDDEAHSHVRLLPGFAPMTDYLVRFGCGRCVYSGSAGGLEFSSEFCASEEGLQMRIHLRNKGENRRKLRLRCSVNWLMGTDTADRAMLKTWSKRGACFASGTAAGIGLLAADDYAAVTAKDEILDVPLVLEAKGAAQRRFLLGWAENISSAEELAKKFRRGLIPQADTKEFDAMLSKLRIETPDDALNRLMNGFLQAQVLFGRIMGRTGLYQPGGAYGFRDQLQDMLPMIHYDPERVRRHILYCAARQFSAGDVLHWWHDPYTGVRTKISDDLLFLPYVTAQYVLITGDDTVLREEIPFLAEIEIPEGKEDVYADMRPSDERTNLHDHCMRAFRRASRTGEHGLCLMGSGDWNDGMNRVGAEGRGESVWLSMFFAACAGVYAKIAPNPADRIWLTEQREKLCRAIEENGWDGEWYLRAYMDNGGKLGGRECAECRIDAISQAWSVLAGLDKNRSKTAMDAVRKYLADDKTGITKLLDPPFEGKTCDPGYIAAYPAGIRENGAQYTHAACWVGCALARMGDARAHKALRMLLPVYHSDTHAKADIYRVEPYVMAADVYADRNHAGRGGWTWYTGSAAWMLQLMLEILGYERLGNRVRLRALLGDWESASITIQFGTSEYRLECLAKAKRITIDGEALESDFVEMQDDGKKHIAIFPPKEVYENIT